MYDYLLNKFHYPRITRKDFNNLDKNIIKLANRIINNDIDYNQFQYIYVTQKINSNELLEAVKFILWQETFNILKNVIMCMLISILLSFIVIGAL